LDNQSRSFNPSVISGESPRKSQNIRDYWKVIRGRLWTIVTVFVIVVSFVALYTLSQTRIYRSVVTVEVRSETRKILPGQDVSGMGVSSFSWGAEERFYNTQIEILRSRDLAERVVKRLGLAADPSFEGIKDPIYALSQMITAVPRTDTGIIEISMQGPDPKRITEIVNAVAEEYVRRNIDRAKENLTELLKEMDEQVSRLSESTQAAEKKSSARGPRPTFSCRKASRRSSASSSRSTPNSTRGPRSSSDSSRRSSRASRR
jgi:uncharacterized protein involved in exopolysaccharide biosynthesis